MPTTEFPLFSPVYKGLQDVALSDYSAVQYNGFIDPLMGLNIRPGEALAANPGARSDGIFFWPDKNYFVCVEDQSVTLRQVVAGGLVDFAASATANLESGVPVTFANAGDYVFIAGGKKLHYIDAFGALTELSDVDAPSRVTHVDYLDGYILATDTGGRFRYSGVSTPTAWAALDFATAEGSPDDLIALKVCQRQIYLFGASSTEIWENDGDTPFSRIPGGMIEIGCAAKYSIIKRDDRLYWLSNRWQIVEFSGVKSRVISERYDREIGAFSKVDDCIGGIVSCRGHELLLFHFPSEGRTLAYDPMLEDWSEWGVWDSSGMVWTAYDYRGSAQDIRTGATFVGKGTAGLISRLTFDSREDLTSGAVGTRFKFLRRTGYIDNGSLKRKRLEQLSFRVRRGGAGALVSEPKLMFRYRDDGDSEWSTIEDLDLGEIGETEHVVTIKRLGVYKTRQFEISSTDDVPVSFAKAEGEVTVLR